MTESQGEKESRLAKLREKRAIKRARTGDSPEKEAERHKPPEGVVDKMLRIGGVERESRLKK
jgi:hypothetical protein